MKLAALLKNWKTTSAGLTLIVGSVTHLVFSVKGHSATEETWTTAILGTITGFGFLVAADTNGQTPDTTSPQANAKQNTPPSGNP